jgi:hypothetical protein
VRRIVSVSGGMQSAVCAQRVIDRYGTDGLTLFFADTLAEDADLYRFLADLERRWGVPVTRHTEGRTPLQVAQDERIIPNQKIAPCTHRLKIEPFLAYLKACPKPVTVYLGMAFWEKHRMDAPRKRYEAVDGVTVDYPSLWSPVDYRPPAETIRAWGIEPPRQYAEGYQHGNCAGACVKQGKGDWLRLLRWKPDLYRTYEQWEAGMRAKGPPFDGYAFCRDERGGSVRPLTLRELREGAEGRQELQPTLFDLDDAEGCLQCSI